MDFLKSVLSEEDAREPQPSSDSTRSPPSGGGGGGGAWSFGDLIKTLATRSESVMETYRRDLEEFRSGLRKETAVIREAASRAVKDLPQSLEAGASVAQESLESVGQAIDDIGATVWKSTTTIVTRGRETLLAPDPGSDSDDASKAFGDGLGPEPKKYSRFEMQLRSIQCDAKTFCEDPEDSEEYRNWRTGFVLDEKEGEMQSLMGENGVLAETYGNLVPGRVDRESFWCRYFYKTHKLRQAEEARAELVRRAISGDQEEDLSWDIDDDDEESNGLDKKDSTEVGPQREDVEKDESKERCPSTEGEDVAIVQETGSDRGERAEVRTDNGDSCKDSDVSIVSSQPSMPEEEDLGWDEIEDIPSNEENKGEAAFSTNRADLHKRLSAAEAEEDLSWDIEDDVDETVKS